MKWKDRKGNMKSVYQSYKEKIIGKIELSGETQSDVSDMCNASVAVNVVELAAEVTKLKKDIGTLKYEITEIRLTTMSLEDKKKSHNAT